MYDQGRALFVQMCSPIFIGGGSSKDPARTVRNSCELPSVAPPVEFYAYRDVPAQAVAWGKRIMAAGKLDVGGIEYLEAPDGRLYFYDLNANSNLRPSIAAEYGFDPFERVVDFLVRERKRVQPAEDERAFA